VVREERPPKLVEVDLKLPIGSGFWFGRWDGEGKGGSVEAQIDLRSPRSEGAGTERE
jgi:hypothetical protein